MLYIRVPPCEGGSENSVYDTDTNWDYKQESNFQYLFGVKEPDCLGLLRVSDAKAAAVGATAGRIWEGESDGPRRAGHLCGRSGGIARKRPEARPMSER